MDTEGLPSNLLMRGNPMAAFYNQATLQLGNVTVESNVVTGEIVSELTAYKSAVNETYQQGSVITYTVSLINAGTSAYADLTLTDDLGAYALASGLTVTPLTYVEGTLQYYVNGILHPTPQIAAESPLTITGVDVPANGNALLLYQAVTNEYAPLTAGSTIENTVTDSGARITEDITASAVISAQTGPVVSIAKAVNPATVTENGQITYIFDLENTGIAAVEGGAVLTDQFSPILSDLQVTCNGTAWTQGTQYTYDTATGLFTTLADQITIPAGTVSQDPDTGAWTVTPGTSRLVITGTV